MLWESPLTNVNRWYPWKTFYIIRCLVRLWIKTRSWDVAFLAYSRWPTWRSALIYGRTIKILNCHAALPLLICSLSRHQPEDTRVRWPWDMWCTEPQVYSRDQPIFCSDPVSSPSKSSIICLLSKKSLTLGLLFSASVK